MRGFRFSSLAVLTLLLAACSRPDQASMSHAPAAASTAADSHSALTTETAASAEKADAAAVDAQQLLASQAADGSKTPPGRQFVRTAELRFEVNDVYQSALALEDAVAAEGGFVVENRVKNRVLSTRYYPLADGKRKEVAIYRPEGQLIVRLPSERILPFLRVAARQMAFLDERSFRAEDIQFALLRQQLEWQRGQEISADIARAAADPGRVGDKVDAATARAEALRLRDEARVRQRELEDQVAFGTLTLQLHQDALTRSETRLDPEATLRTAGPGLGQRLLLAMSRGWQGLLDLLVLLAYLWPLWVLMLIGLFATHRIWRAWRRRRFADRGSGR